MALEEKYGDKIDFVIADVDKEQDLVARFKVYSIPAFFFIGTDGSIVDTDIGYVPLDQMESKMQNFISKAQ